MCNWVDVCSLLVHRQMVHDIMDTYVLSQENSQIWLKHVPGYSGFLNIAMHE